MNLRDLPRIHSQPPAFELRIWKRNPVLEFEITGSSKDPRELLVLAAAASAELSRRILLQLVTQPPPETPPALAENPNGL